MPNTRTNSQVAKLKQLSLALAESFKDEQAYLDLTCAAADLFDANIALISLQNGDSMWFKTRVGLEITEIPKQASFCEWAMQFCDRVFVVEDTAKDPRFANNALVTGPLGIRFYVGAPLVTSTRQVLGNLCVLDSRPKKLESQQLETLKFLGKQVTEMLEKSKAHISPISPIPSQ